VTEETRNERRRELAAVLGQFCDSLDESHRQLEEAFAATLTKDGDDA
jgi:hypothetical protein